MTFLPSYGPEMRGGTANCTVIVSDSVISCPIVDKASCLVAMNQPSLDRFAAMAEAKGSIFINSSLVSGNVNRKDVSVHRVPAGEIAQNLGNPKAANMVMLGALTRGLQMVEEESMNRVLCEIFSGPKKHLLEVNRKAFFAG